METYYFSPTGNDDNNGLSELNPWRTFAKLKGNRLEPGSKVLLHGGANFMDSMDLGLGEIQGSPEAPITLGSYGRGKATITATNRNAIACWNARNFIVQSLILQGDCNEFGWSGLLLSGGEDITVHDLEIHGFTLGGIETNAGGQDFLRRMLIADTRLSNNANGTHIAQVKGLTLDKCQAVQNDWLGTAQAPIGGYGFGLHWCEDVRVTQCLALANGGKTVRAGGHGGYLFQECSGAQIHYCRAVKNSDATELDGQGFCFYGSEEVTAFHLYSEGNMHGGYSFFHDGYTKPVRNVIVSNSVSLNDIVGVAFHEDVSDCHFVNSPMVYTHSEDGVYRKCLDVYNPPVLGENYLYGNNFRADYGAVLAEITSPALRPLRCWSNLLANHWPRESGQNYHMNNIHYGDIRGLLAVAATEPGPIPVAKQRSTRGTKKHLVGKNLRTRDQHQPANCRPGLRISQESYTKVVGTYPRGKGVNVWG